MPKLSLNKIIAATIAIMVLINLRNILTFFEPLFFWFQDSLDGLYDFPEGAQTAIAFLTIILVIVLVTKRFR
jgi:hypothetical protein